MSYCPVNHVETFLDTPHFYSTFLYSFGCLALPVYLFGGYCILFKTPSKMKSVQMSLLNYHFWSCLLDFGMCILTTPFMLCPLMAGYPLGVLRFTGMSNTLQIGLMMTVETMIGVSILTLFENRYVVFIRERGDHWWMRARRVWYFFIYLVALTMFMLVHWFLPTNPKNPIEFILEKIPCLPKEAREAPLFLLSEETGLLPLLSALFSTSTVIQTLFMVYLVTRTLNKFHSNISKSTADLQKKFTRALLLQSSLPFFIIFIPISYFFFSNHFSYYNQGLNNISYIFLSTHGFFSTIAVLTIHAPYREVVVQKFGCFKKIQNQRSISVVSISVTNNIMD